MRLSGATPQQTVWIKAVPEPKTAKNHLHLDIHTGSVAELVELGASVLDDTLPWTEMADPDWQRVLRIHTLTRRTADVPHKRRFTPFIAAEGTFAPSVREPTPKSVSGCLRCLSDR
jgi:hypothetical protein